MATAHTYPGVYVEEVPSGVRPIAGVSTSDTAFVGYFSRGPLNAPTKVTSPTEAERVFGTALPDSEAALQLGAYFANGGGVAWVVRIASVSSMRGECGSGSLRRRGPRTRSASPARTT